MKLISEYYTLVTVNKSIICMICEYNIYEYCVVFVFVHSKYFFDGTYALSELGNFLYWGNAENSS